MPEQSKQTGAPTETSFEEAFAELEDVVQQLEERELSLEESIALYERGQLLARLCQERLDQAELRVEQLEATSQPDEYEGGGPLC